MSDRRTFLRHLGLVSLPLIGGGVTLIGKPAAAAVPLVQAIAAPTLLDDPRQRARYAWEAFSAAMRDMTADADGWLVMGGERDAVESHGVPASAWCGPRVMRYQRDPLDPRFIADRSEDMPELRRMIEGWT